MVARQVAVHGKERVMKTTRLMAAVLVAAMAGVGLSAARAQTVFTATAPNNTPLEYSERATKMQADYDSKFVPRCRLPG